MREDSLAPSCGVGGSRCNTESGKSLVGPCKTESSQKPVPFHPLLTRSLEWQKRCVFKKPDDWVFASNRSCGTAENQALHGALGSTGLVTENFAEAGDAEEGPHNTWWSKVRRSWPSSRAWLVHVFAIHLESRLLSSLSRQLGVSIPNCWVHSA